MDEFPRAAFKRLGRIVGGGTPRDDEEYWGGDVPWYTPTDVARFQGGLLGEPERFLTEEGLAACSATLIPRGALVITSRAPIGNAALTDRACAINQGCKALVPAAAVEVRFVSYAARAFLAQIRAAGTGTTFQEVSADRLGNVRLPVPSHRHQTAIADFLDRECHRVERARTSARRVASAAQAAYLARAREVILRPEFPRVLIKRVARPGTGHTPSRNRPEYWQEDECHIPWFGLADVWQIRDDNVDTVAETAEQVSELGLAHSAAVRHPAGTVLLSRTASVGFVAMMGVDMAVTQDFMTWSCGPLLLPEFLLHALRACRPEILTLVHGSTHKTIYMPDLLNLRVPLPDLDAQSAIVAELQPLLEARRRLQPTQTALEGALDAYRNSLIHEAVTGKRDVTNIRGSQMAERLHAATEGYVAGASA